MTLPYVPWRGLRMDEALNEASMQRRDFTWLDTKRLASSGHRFGGMYYPTGVRADWKPDHEPHSPSGSQAN